MPTTPARQSRRRLETSGRRFLKNQQKREKGCHPNIPARGRRPPARLGQSTHRGVAARGRRRDVPLARGRARGTRRGVIAHDWRAADCLTSSRVPPSCSKSQPAQSAALHRHSDGSTALISASTRRARRLFATKGRPNAASEALAITSAVSSTISRPVSRMGVHLDDRHRRQSRT